MSPVLRAVAFAADPLLDELVRLGFSRDLVADAAAGRVDRNDLLAWAREFHRRYRRPLHFARCRGPTTLLCDTCERCLAATEPEPQPQPGDPHVRRSA
jgi:hypothetical protein